MTHKNFKYQAYVSISKGKYLELVFNGYFKNYEELGYTVVDNDDISDKEERIVIYNNISDEPFVVACGGEKFDKEIYDKSMIHCYKCLGLFYYTIAINDSDDYQQYFISDDNYRLDPYSWVPKNCFSLSYVKDFSSFYPVHKASPKELYEYFLGKFKPVTVKTVPQDIVNILKTCEGYEEINSPNPPSMEWLHKWLREKHGLYIYIIPRFDGWDHAQYDSHYEIYKFGGRHSIDKYGDGTYGYDDAMMTAIRECLEHHVPKIVFKEKERKEYISPEVTSVTTWASTDNN